MLLYVLWDLAHELQTSLFACYRLDIETSHAVDHMCCQAECFCTEEVIACAQWDQLFGLQQSLRYYPKSAVPHLFS